MSQQINLFNPIFLKQRTVLTALHMAQALGALALLLAGLAAFLHYRSAALQAAAGEGKAQVEASQARLAKASLAFAPRRKSQALEGEIAQLQGQLQSLQEVEAVLKRGDIGNTDGYAEYFRAFARQAAPGLWLTGVDIVGAGQDIVLQGRALQPALIPGYIGRLKDERAMRGKTFGALHISQPMLAEAPVASAAPALPSLSQVPPGTGRPRQPAEMAGAAAEPAGRAATPAAPGLARYVQFSLQSRGFTAEGAK